MSELCKHTNSAVHGVVMVKGQE